MINLMEHRWANHSDTKMAHKFIPRASQCYTVTLRNIFVPHALIHVSYIFRKTRYISPKLQRINPPFLALDERRRSKISSYARFLLRLCEHPPPLLSIPLRLDCVLYRETHWFLIEIIVTLTNAILFFWGNSLLRHNDFLVIWEVKVAELLIE